MKIYTKKGDDGRTSLFGGTRVMKSHQRIESYGTVDELNSQIGLLAAYPEALAYRAALVRIQNNLFVIGSLLASETEHARVKVPQLDAAETNFLETRMDEMDKNLPSLKGFILPGGSIPVAQIHIARCICRRAERHIVALSGDAEIPHGILTYMNRLSDFLFMLARQLAFSTGIEETLWKTT